MYTQVSNTSHPTLLLVIHSNIWGPSRVKNINGARWFVTFIDDHTRITWTCLMKEKSETATIFQSFHTMILTQFKSHIQVLKTNNAKDYFNSILGPCQIMELFTSVLVWTLHNKTEWLRGKIHLLEVARANMFTNNVPKHFWGEAVLTTIYLINRMPSRVLKFHTPRQVLTTIHPHILTFTFDLPLKVFGCTSLSIFIPLIVLNSIQNHSSVYSLVTRLIKKVINVTLPLPGKSTIPWMSPSLRVNHIFLNPTFRGRVPRNIRFGIFFMTINLCL